MSNLNHQPHQLHGRVGYSPTIHHALQPPGQSWVPHQSPQVFGHNESQQLSSGPVESQESRCMDQQSPGQTSVLRHPQSHVQQSFVPRVVHRFPHLVHGNERSPGQIRVLPNQSLPWRSSTQPGPSSESCPKPSHGPVESHHSLQQSIEQRSVLRHPHLELQASNFVKSQCINQQALNSSHHLKEQQGHYQEPMDPQSLPPTIQPNLISILNWQNKQLANMQDQLAKLVNASPQLASTSPDLVSSSIGSMYEPVNIEPVEIKDSSVEEEKQWDGVSSSLELGLTFRTRSQVKKFVTIYGQKCKCKLVVSSGGASDGCKSDKVSSYFVPSCDSS